MLVTECNNTDITTILSFTGTSSDVKPIIIHGQYLISSGSKFTENDTGNKYMYDQYDRKWYLLQD